MQIPIESYLVPAEPRDLPAEMITVDNALTDGLPQTIDLDRDLSVVVVVPTGLATAWRDADPSAVVTTSADELAPADPTPAVPPAGVDRGRLRLLLLQAGAPVAWLPLVAGARRSLPDDGEQGAAVEVAVVGWDVRAGTLRGAGAFGSRLQLAWRRVDRATPTFSAPPLNAQLAKRLAVTESPMSAVADMLAPAAVGNDAGWALAFHKEKPAEHWQIVEPPYLLIGRDDYYAQVEAALPGDFAAGKYTFVVEGMTDDHYRKVAVDDVVRLYLFWRDTNSSPAAYLANIAGLTDKLSDFSTSALEPFRVAELIVTKVSRKAGPRRYEATIEARERAFVRLQQKVLQATLEREDVRRRRPGARRQRKRAAWSCTGSRRAGRCPRRRKRTPATTRSRSTPSRPPRGR